MAITRIEETTAFQEHAELEMLRKFRDAVEQIAETDFFTGRLMGFEERDDAEEDSEAAYDLIAAVIENLRRERDRAAGHEVPGSWVRDDDGCEVITLEQARDLIAGEGR